MELLKELLIIAEKKDVTRSVAAAVYHRDYVKTKKKPYRKYDPKKRKEQELKEACEPMAMSDWKEQMKKAGAVKFEQAEMDTTLAYNKSGKCVGGYDKQKKAAHDAK